jgi:hypothetical protein
MQHRTPLRGIDRIAAKHGGDARRQLGRTRELEQQIQRLPCDALARKIKQPAVVLGVEILPTLCVGGGQIAQLRVADVSSVRIDGAPRGKRGI